jgi:predicted nucleic acid-binding protein
MIILDTNVISELMRATPDKVVMTWVNSRPLLMLYTTSVSKAEILRGIMLLAKGKRRDAIAAAASDVFERDFAGRILSFDVDAATEYAAVAVARRTSGRPISAFDAQIAAIARTVGARLATRDVDDFADCGLDVIDPWAG